MCVLPKRASVAYRPHFCEPLELIPAGAHVRCVRTSPAPDELYDPAAQPTECHHPCTRPHIRAISPLTSPSVDKLTSLPTGLLLITMTSDGKRRWPPSARLGLCFLCSPDVALHTSDGSALLERRGAVHWRLVCGLERAQGGDRAQGGSM